LEFARRPDLTNSTSEIAIYGFVHRVTPGNIVVNRDNHLVLALGWNSFLASAKATRWYW